LSHDHDIDTHLVAQAIHLGFNCIAVPDGVE
jgi:hypothetical protein